MPLHLKLRRGEKLLVNGAVLELGQRYGEIVVHNQSNCLRGSDLLTEDEASTPTKRVYFAVQMMIVDPANAAAAVEQFHSLMGELDAAILNPDIKQRLAEVRAEVAGGRAYRALSLLRMVLKYEDLLLAAAKLETARQLERDAHAAAGRRTLGQPA